MLAALGREVHGLDVSWNRPEGGMFLWGRLPEGMSATSLLPRALEHGVAFMPGAAPVVCHRTAAEIDAGIAQLAKTIREAR